MIAITQSDVEIEVRAEPEDIPIHGNAMASGNEKQIMDELIYNDWAWCCAVVEVSWKGLSETVTLGCCSYSSEEDFRACPYFQDMVNEALESLNANVIDIVSAVSEIRVD